MRLLAIAAVLSLTAGCGATIVAPPTATTPGYPVTVTNRGQPLTFPGAPKRVVTNDIGITELMFPLGLADRMAGYVIDSGQAAGTAGSPWHADHAQVPRLAKTINKEVVLAVGADLVFAGWHYGFTQTSGFTPLALIARYQEQIAAVRAQVANRPHPTVFPYDSGTQAPFTSGGLAAPQHIIAAAAGVPAVRDRRLYALPCAALVESPRNPAAIVAFANYLASIGQ